LKTLLRITILGSLATGAAFALPGAHALPGAPVTSMPSGVGCVAVGDPRPATPLEIVGTCDFVARGQTASYTATAAHWQILVNDHVKASGFGPLQGAIHTAPGDTVTAYVFPDCDHLCLGVGSVTLTDGDEPATTN